MSSLTRFDNDGIEIIIETATGESFASVKGYARMSGKAQSTISERFKGVREDEVKTAEIPTPGGLQAVRLIPEDLIVQWLPKDNPEMASKMMKLGVRMFNHKLAGYSLSSTAVQHQLKVHTAVEYIQASEKLEEINNLTLRELLRDQLIEELSHLQNKKALPESSPSPEYTTCKVRARELGYSTTEVGNGSSLGKFIAKYLTCAFKERVGKYEVKHYEVNDRLDTLIHNFFGMKKALSV